MKERRPEIAAESFGWADRERRIEVTPYLRRLHAVRGLRGFEIMEFGGHVLGGKVALRRAREKRAAAR
jgi:hypothetical protein